MVLFQRNNDYNEWTKVLLLLNIWIHFFGDKKIFFMVICWNKMHYFSGISDSHVVNNVTSMHETQFQMSFLNICLQKCFTLYGNDFQKSKQFNFILSPRFTEKRGLMAWRRHHRTDSALIVAHRRPFFWATISPRTFVIPVCCLFAPKNSSIHPRQRRF